MRVRSLEASPTENKHSESDYPVRRERALMPFMRQRERDPLAHSNANTAQCGWHEEQETLNQAYFRVDPESAECVQKPIDSRLLHSVFLPIGLRRKESAVEILMICGFLHELRRVMQGF